MKTKTKISMIISWCIIFILCILQFTGEWIIAPDSQERFLFSFFVMIGVVCSLPFYVDFEEVKEAKGK